MRTRAPRRDKNADAALTAGLNHRARRLAEQRQVPRQKLRAVAFQQRQPVVLRGNFFGLVADQGEVKSQIICITQRGKGVDVARHAGLHVHRAAPPQHIALHVVRDVVRDRHRINMPRQHHALRQPTMGARHERVAASHNLHARQVPQRGLKGIGEGLFVVGGGRDVDKLFSQLNWVGEDIHAGDPSTMTRMPAGARAIGIANIAANGTVLDAWFPAVSLIDDAPTPSTRRVSANELSPRLLHLVGMDRDRNVEVVPVCTEIADLDAPPIDAFDVYLRLHLLSHRKVKPLEINMTGALDHLEPVVWTNKGPCRPDDFEFVRTHLRARGTIHVYGIERLPRMVDYVVPTGVTITEAERVRLGAYLAEGTTVVREGYVSFNAGSLGPARIEGTLSSSVVVGAHTTLERGSALMATRTGDLSRAPMHIGNNCYLHPTASINGISLGNNCNIGAGVILEPHTPIFDPSTGNDFPAENIAGSDNVSIQNEPYSSIPVLRWRI